MKKYINNIVLSFIIFTFSFISANAQLKVEESLMTIPTYKNLPPNPMPRFYQGKSHQGVQRRIYPYPYDDNQVNYKTDVDYPYIHIENEYIDLGVMPNLGGRIYYAVDKTNNYDWFYHNHVVKPSLIGMLGNWISGSLAWGYPHHHGPNTVADMDYKIENHNDGSSTIWITSTDYRHRVSILLGYTFYPNSSLVEMTIHPINKTPISNSFLFWANPAVYSDTSYQVIFPPSVQYVTYHSKTYMTSWPIADSRFSGYDFTGYDISWWKNTFIPVSFFAWDPQEDYFGGYDYAKHAGTAWIGNHHIMPGMKYWADGNNPNGLRTNEGLTDDSGRYTEMMAGFYTDNQPDYSWLQPYETKEGTMIWFPIRELEGLKYANRNGALNLEVKDNKIIFRMNSTFPHKNAVATLKTVQGKVLVQKTINISPAEPFVNDIDLPEGITELDLVTTLVDADGNELLAYKPNEYQYPKEEKPETFKNFPAPEEVKSVEELYLIGLRINQFYNANIDPMLYYNEALKRDPGDYRVNTQLGILALKDFKWEEAAKYLKTAYDRITSNYTRPKDAEGLYYYAIALEELGKIDEAYDIFYEASWASAWHSASYYQLAEIAVAKGDYVTALDHLNRSLSTNTDNPRAYDLKAIVLRKLNNLPEAEKLLLETQKQYKIDHQSLHELYLVYSSQGKTAEADAVMAEMIRVMRDDIQSYLELATYYQASQLYDEALDVLSIIEKRGSTWPMLYYYKGYYNHLIGNDDLAKSYYIKANEASYTYCFPFRSEEIAMLENAQDLYPEGAKAPYYLGNLLYEIQPEKAMTQWEKSIKLDPSFYIVQRNLGYAYKDIKKDYVTALSYMNNAASVNKTDVRLLFEVDEINELNKVSPKEKYLFLKEREKIANTRSDALLRLATRSVEYGKFDEAIKLLTTNSIKESEGAREMQTTYLNAYILRSLQSYNKGKYSKALEDIEIAAAYPIGLVGRSRFAQFDYLRGMIYNKTGKKAEAQKCFEGVVSMEISESGADSEYLFYKGLALRELGKTEEATQLFTTMLDNAQKGNIRESRFGQFGSAQTSETRLTLQHYLMGLAYEGLGDKVNAKKEYNDALIINPSHIWSKTHLDSLK